MLRDALHQLNVPLPPAKSGNGVAAGVASDMVALIKVRTVDGRRQTMHGEVLVEKIRISASTSGHGGDGDEEDVIELLEVRFVKIKGDPLEWRRFFKKVALLCRDAIYSPESEGGA